MIQNWKDKRVTVMGLGRFGGGVGVTRWLAGAGAKVLLTDKAEPGALKSSLEQIADCDVTLHLGGHDERDFRETDLVVVSPAVPETNEYLAAARDAGAPITTEINLFVERCPAKTVGVTGTVGKSTTTAMIGHILERTLTDRRIWVGGNLGRSLLDKLPQMTDDDIVVLELSSFQLARTPLVCWSPHTAVITSLAPNHLDWHGGFEAYAATKFDIARFQNLMRDNMVYRDDAELHRRLKASPTDVSAAWRFRLYEGSPMMRRAMLGVFWENVRLAIPGQHNLLNAAAALGVAHCLEVKPDDAVAALASFEGLPHRLQRVAVRDDVTWYNDSKSTTPESAITAMNALAEPLLIILGGYDKGSDLTAAAALAAERCKFAACIGETGPGLVEAIRNAGGTAEYFEEFASAVAACGERADSGDAVLLSPACASWGMFTDYRQRGDEFVRLASGRA